MPENQPVPVPLTQVQPAVPPPGAAIPVSEPVEPIQNEQITREPEPVESPEEEIPLAKPAVKKKPKK